jgi:hypothetical protein
MTWHRLGRDADHPAGIARYLVRDDTLYIWCDGTRNRREWRENFQPRKQALSPGSRARVNVKDYLQAWEVLRALPRLITLDTRVWIGGYSLGYAVALILGWLIRGYAASVTVLGFAGKRVGNRAFHDELVRRGVGHSNTSYRWDIVPWLPPHYARGPQDWIRDKYWPVKAHLKAGHDAAYWRHELTKEAI